MSSRALMLARPITTYDAARIDAAPTSLGELASLGAPTATAPLDTQPPELLRLGPELPSVAASHALGVDAPALSVLGEIARIGDHLGPLERAERALTDGDRLLASERLARVRTLVDCASALADLRGGVLAAMRTARPA